MKFPSAEKITDHLILTVMMIFLFFLINTVLMFIIGPWVINSKYPYVYMACQAIVTVMALKFFYKKLSSSIRPGETVQLLSPAAAAFTGIVRGIVFAGTVLIASMLVMMTISPEKLFHPEIYKIAAGTAVAGAVAGAFFPLYRIGRKTRLWLLLAAACVFFILQILKIILMMFINTPFDYTSETVLYSKFPAIGRNTLEKCLPAGASGIRIHGIRGRRTIIRWEAKCSQEAFDEFCKKNGYNFLKESSYKPELFELENLPADAVHGGKIFQNKTILIFIYSPSAGKMYGVLDSRAGA